MPLSEHEQRLLEQMERALYAEDPKFASSLRSSGVAALVAGAATSIVLIGVLGFVLMLVGTFLVIRALRAPAADTSGAPAAPGKPAAAKKPGFMDKAEERFRKRREGGEL